MYKYLVEEVGKNNNLYYTIIETVDKYLSLKSEERNFINIKRIRGDLLYPYVAGQDMTLSISNFLNSKIS